MLELSAAVGEIDLKYVDESGFCAWSEPSYSYYFRGQQKRLEQSQRRGRRLSISDISHRLILSGFRRGLPTSQLKIAVSRDEQPQILHSQEAVVQPPQVHDLTIQAPSSSPYQLIANR